MSCRGGFHPTQADQMPAAGQTVIIIGNSGASFWQRFRRGENPGDDPLEDWTRAELTSAANDLGAAVLFPFDGPPYHPIMQWAKKAEAVFPSLYGPLIHPEYGLWHAYRGVLVFADNFDLPAGNPAPNPCITCVDQPCLNTCPVDAVSTGTFNRDACAGYLGSAEGRNCLELGCAARRACPIGAAHLYSADQRHFHMRAFLDNYRRT